MIVVAVDVGARASVRVPVSRRASVELRATMEMCVAAEVGILVAGVSAG